MCHLGFCVICTLTAQRVIILLLVYPLNAFWGEMDDRVSNQTLSCSYFICASSITADDF